MIATLAAVALAAAPSIAHRRVMAPDGTALAVYRYALPGATRTAPPVILVPDLGFSRAAYDFEGRGLARWLVERGREVYVVELRGQGKAGVGVSLDAFSRDLAAVLDVVGAESIDLVVHGWAGALVVAALVDDRRVRRIVALNVPVLAEPPSELATTFLTSGARFTHLASSPAGFERFEWLFSSGSAFPARSVSAFLSNGTRDLSRPVAAELLAWMQLGDRPFGAESIVARLSRVRVPTLLILGLADGWAPPELCAVWRERSAAVSLRTLNRLEAGDDFSHLGLLLGTGAPTFVFPELARFLE